MNNAATDQDHLDAFLSRNEEPADRHHDCCPVCDLELCLVDDHPKFGACPCGLPRWSDHEGSPCCEERAAGNDNQGAA